jgi:hypothetical protein
MPVATRPAPTEARDEIEPAVQEELLAYPGKWVALTRSEVLAVSDSASEAYERARQLGVDTPIMYLVPEGGDRSYYY